MEQQEATISQVRSTAARQEAAITQPKSAVAQQQKDFQSTAAHQQTTLPAKNSINRSPLRRGLLLIALALSCFALSPAPKAFGVTPPPDGGYPGSNMAEGDNALQSFTTGGGNTAIGSTALYQNTTGNFNTANGVNALYSNTDGGYNTATGLNALFSNRTGGYNAANGAYALQQNTTGGYNTANGAYALQQNTTGSSNTANGVNALYSNDADNNTANGYQALFNNTTGTQNTANGVAALFSNTTGSSNIALGGNAGLNLTTGSNNIDIGNTGVASDAKKIRIGTRLTHTNTYIAGISGVMVAGGVGVIIDTNGHLGTVVSSARFKQDIHSMDRASEAILALKPVTFRYKHELDPEGIVQFGLVAEEVQKVNPALVVRDADGKPYTVRYEAVNAMLLNEFLKQHRAFLKEQRKVEEQDRTVQEQQKEIKALAAQLREQAALLQRVSDHLELNKSAPQMVVNNQ